LEKGVRAVGKRPEVRGKIMALKKYKPSTPGKRWANLPDFAELTKDYPEKSLTETLNKTGGPITEGASLPGMLAAGTSASTGS